MLCQPPRFVNEFEMFRHKLKTTLLSRKKQFKIFDSINGVSEERENRKQIQTRTDLGQENERRALTKTKAVWAKKLAKRTLKKEWFKEN